MGCVTAHGNNLSWWKQIYVIRYDTVLETDVRDVYITSLKIKDGNLIVENERGYIYSLVLNTLEVTPLKGNTVIDTPIKR